MIAEEGSEAAHHEFLFTETGNPDGDLIAALRAVMPNTGRIMWPIATGESTRRSRWDPSVSTAKNAPSGLEGSAEKKPMISPELRLLLSRDVIMLDPLAEGEASGDGTRASGLRD